MSSAFATPRRRTPRYERLVNGKAVEDNGQRCCRHPECTTKLSRYNPDDTCNVHGGWTDESVPRRGRRSQPSGATVPDAAVSPGPDTDGLAEGPPERTGDLAALTPRRPASAPGVIAEVSLELAGAEGDRCALADAVFAGAGSAVSRRSGALSGTVTGSLSEVLDAVGRLHEGAIHVCTHATTTVRVSPLTRLEARGEAAPPPDPGR